MSSLLGALLLSLASLALAGCALGSGPQDGAGLEGTPGESAGPGTPTPIPGWAMYVNESYRYSLQYPGEVTLSVEDKASGVIALREASGRTFQVVASEDYLPADGDYFLDTPSSGQRSLAGFVWKEFVIPEGYCDGPGCSGPIYALRTVQGGILYSLIFHDQERPTALQEAILASMRLRP